MVKKKDASAGRVMVFARSRPFLSRESGDLAAVEMMDEAGQVVVRSSPDALSVLKETKEVQIDRKERSFKMDGVFAEESSQKEVFQRVGLPVLVEVMKGFNGCIFAYGQTGSGKTHSLLNTEVSDLEDVGILPRLVATMYARAAMDKQNVYTIKAGGFQVYNEQVDDLLHPEYKKGQGQNLNINKGGGMPDLTWTDCVSPADMLGAFKRARSGIYYAETKMNKSSSRSHAIFQIRVTRRQRVSSEGTGGGGAQQDGGARRMQATCGQLSVVDLAGSERVKRSGVTGSNFKEATNINGSLLALGNVIQALADKRKHVPFRDSKLTRILEGSVGGNCKTALLVCVSPSDNSTSETMSTLEFASRAMCVEVNAKVNETIVEIDASLLAADMEDTGGAAYVDEEMLKTYKESEQALAVAEEKAAEHEKNAFEMRSRLSHMERALDDKQQAMTKVQEEQKRQGSHIDLLKKELQQTELAHTDEVRKSDVVKQDLQSQLQRATGEIAGANKAMAKLKRKFDDEKMSKAAADARLALLEQQLATQGSEASEVLVAARSTEARLVAQLEAQSAESATAETQLRAEIGAERARAEQLDQSLKTIQAEKHELQGNLTAMNANLGTVSNLLALEKEKVDSLSQVQAEAQELRAQLVTFKTQEEELRAKIVAVHEERGHLSQQTASLESTHAELQRSFDQETEARRAVEGEKRKLLNDLAVLEKGVAHGQEQLERSKAQYAEEIISLRALHDEDVSTLRRKSLQESERQAEHAAQAMQALELRAQHDQEKMQNRLVSVEATVVQRSVEHSDEVTHLKRHYDQHLANALQRERQEHAKQADKLNNELNAAAQRLADAQAKANDDATQAADTNLLKLTHCRLANQTARAAVERDMDRLRHRYAKLHARFVSRESRPDDVRRITQQQRELTEMRRAVKNAKLITKQKQLELEHVVDNVRIFGTSHDKATTKAGKVLPGQKVGERATFQSRRTRDPASSSNPGARPQTAKQAPKPNFNRPETPLSSTSAQHEEHFAYTQEDLGVDDSAAADAAAAAAARPETVSTRKRRPLPTPPM